MRVCDEPHGVGAEVIADSDVDDDEDRLEVGLAIVLNLISRE